jgi:hypothetical protein
MSIWGRRDGEPPDEETPESRAEARESQAGAPRSQAEVHDAQEPAAEHGAGEPAPAFWRAQGETPASVGRDPADAPQADYEHVPDNPPAAGVPTTMSPTPAYAQQAPGQAPAPAASEDPVGADEPAPILAGVVIDGDNPVKDPGLTEMPADQAGTHDAQTGGPQETGVQEPTVAVAREPVVNDAEEPAVAEHRGEVQEPAMTEAEQPSAVPEPAVTEMHQPSVAEPEGPVVSGSPEPAAGGDGRPVAVAVTPQRWSEILVAFVDDPRASVKMAADAVDEAIDEFVNSVRARQRGLAATWQSDGADTEQLRTALREYRKLGQRVQQLDLGEKTGG